MKILFTLFVVLMVSLFGWSQTGFLAPMPEPVSNNAVALATVGGVPHVYSFSGIDTTKIWSGIHKKGFRYNTATDEWDGIDPLPSGNGRIAAGASTVKNKIYIIGGYEVFPGGNEVSYDLVHIYDPETNSYLPNGSSIPIPIDDHVQAVWRDSLIFVVTGWSNNGNVPNVQIYNPSSDEWFSGTSVPNNDDYKVFGGSGVIIEDTIYYAGGASDACCSPAFPPVPFFRKGAINPNNPGEIIWTDFQSESASGYRWGAAVLWNSFPIWFGGSELTYNFDGIDYNGSGGVPPTAIMTIYFPSSSSFGMENFLPAPVMDLRGVAQLDDARYIIAGGMTDGQAVTNQTLIIDLSLWMSVGEAQNRQPSLTFPNPASSIIRFEKEGSYTVSILNLEGKELIRQELFFKEELDVSALPNGVYLVKIEGERPEKLIIQR